MRKTLRLMPVLLIAAVAIPAMPARPAAAAGKIVVRGTYKRMSTDPLSITYSSAKGSYTATWIGVRRYRLRGTITGRRLTGRIRTRQAADGTRYIARGYGRLGSRRVRITGGGPNSLRTARLVLTWPV